MSQTDNRLSISRDILLYLRDFRTRYDGNLSRLGMFKVLIHRILCYHGFFIEQKPDGPNKPPTSNQDIMYIENDRYNSYWYRNELVVDDFRYNIIFGEDSEKNRNVDEHSLLRVEVNRKSLGGTIRDKEVPRIRLPAVPSLDPQQELNDKKIIIGVFARFSKTFGKLWVFAPNTAPPCSSSRPISALAQSNSPSCSSSRRISSPKPTTSTDVNPNDNNALVMETIRSIADVARSSNLQLSPENGTEVQSGQARNLTEDSDSNLNTPPHSITVQEEITETSDLPPVKRKKH